jgi:hypothetical protein
VQFGDRLRKVRVPRMPFDQILEQRERRCPITGRLERERLLETRTCIRD